MITCCIAHCAAKMTKVKSDKNAYGLVVKNGVARCFFTPFFIIFKKCVDFRSLIMSCCPPNAEKYLAATYETIGKVCCLSNGHEFYSTGPTDSRKAVILIPDVYGWNGGRTRKIADWFGEAGYNTAVPKLMVPPLEGGTDGDG